MILLYLLWGSVLVLCVVAVGIHAVAFHWSQGRLTVMAVDGRNGFYKLRAKQFRRNALTRLVAKMLIGGGSLIALTGVGRVSASRVGPSAALAAFLLLVVGLLTVDALLDMRDNWHLDTNYGPELVPES